MKTVLVIFGGRSAEHDVSIITAHIPIIQALSASPGYQPVPLYISADGAWYSDPSLLDIKTFQRPDFNDHLARLKPVQLSLGRGLTLVWPGLRPKTLAIDVAFPATHGTYGEDGSLMGLLRMAGVPFVGCDLEASVIAMDKVLTKRVTEAAGIPSVKYVAFSAASWAIDEAPIRKQISALKYPLFVKPPHLGSSIGITKVDKPTGLDNALEVALHYDDAVLVEESVPNLIEVTLPIMGNHDPRPALVEKTHGGFFDFTEKYLKNGGKKGGSDLNSSYSELPAKIGGTLTKQVTEMGLATYRAIGATGIARIDFLINSKTNQVFMNEVNPLPGSLYHHNWRAAGVSPVELVTELIRLAEERHAERAKTTFVFRSDVLKHIGGPKTQS